MAIMKDLSKTRVDRRIKAIRSNDRNHARAIDSPHSGEEAGLCTISRRPYFLPL